MKARMLWAPSLALTITVCGCQSLNSNPRSWFSGGGRDKSTAMAMTNPVPATVSQPMINQTAFEQQPSQPPMAAGRADQLLSDGQRAVQRGDYVTARRSFNEVLQGAPGDATAHHGLAIVCDLNQEWQEAEQHYQQALRSRPQDPNLLGDLGYSYLLQNRDWEAVQYLKQAITVKPDHQVAYVNLAKLSLRQGDRQQAEAWLRQTFPEQQIPQYVAQLEQQQQEIEQLSGNDSGQSQLAEANGAVSDLQSARRIGSVTSPPIGPQPRVNQLDQQLTASQQRFFDGGTHMLDAPATNRAGVMPAAAGRPVLGSAAHYTPSERLGFPSQSSPAPVAAASVHRSGSGPAANGIGVAPAVAAMEQQPIHVFPEHMPRRPLESGYEQNPATGLAQNGAEYAGNTGFPAPGTGVEPFGAVPGMLPRPQSAGPSSNSGQMSAQQMSSPQYQSALNSRFAPPEQSGLQYGEPQTGSLSQQSVPLSDGLPFTSGQSGLQPGGQWPDQSAMPNQTAASDVAPQIRPLGTLRESTSQYYGGDQASVGPAHGGNPEP
ncbi:MAG: tetratricopeptide repeat protein, partial [Planctomycetaceae bacterium]|nr:tetratricopeptide repeat protein [Planctomycetaceae bacterium]